MSPISRKKLQPVPPITESDKILKGLCSNPGFAFKRIHKTVYRPNEAIEFTVEWESKMVGLVWGKDEAGDGKRLRWYWNLAANNDVTANKGTPIGSGIKAARAYGSAGEATREMLAEFDKRAATKG